MTLDVDSAVCVPRGSLHGNRESNHEIRILLGKKETTSQNLQLFRSSFLLLNTKNVTPAFSLVSPVALIYTAT